MQYQIKEILYSVKNNIYHNSGRNEKNGFKAPSLINIETQIIPFIKSSISLIIEYSAIIVQYLGYRRTIPIMAKSSSTIPKFFLLNPPIRIEKKLQL